MQIDTRELRFEGLSDKNANHIIGFCSTSTELESFLKEDALKDSKRRISTTHLVFYEGKVVGYFTLVNDRIDVKHVENSGLEGEYPYQKYPAIKIARLSTHKNYERMGIGRHMLSRAIAYAIRITNFSGCYIITVDAKPESVDFYKKYGFRQVKRKSGTTIPMYLNYSQLLETRHELQRGIDEWLNEG